MLTNQSSKRQATAKEIMPSRRWGYDKANDKWVYAWTTRLERQILVCGGRGGGVVVETHRRARPEGERNVNKGKTHKDPSLITI